MEAKVTRGERLLNNYAKRSGMSEEGKQWLIGAIDPFHDKPLQLNGYPDGTAGKSVIQCIKLAMDIARPATVALGSQWDCLVTTDNFLDVSQLIKAKMGGGISSIEAASAPTSTNYSGGLRSYSGPTGMDFSLNLTATPSIRQTLAAPDGLYQGKLRVISTGFEVQNTSNELVKNGSVTCFELAQVVPHESFALGICSANGAACLGAASFLPTTKLPASLAQATQIPGAKTWEAKDGCYCVIRQNSLNNPATRPHNVSPLLLPDAVDFPLNPTDVYADLGTPYGVMLGPSPSFPVPFHGKAAYFTNLSDLTTLHVNYNIWVERFPTPAQFDLSSLATESCDYDPVALEAWSTISAQMPVAVVFKENGLGDWFTGEIASLIDSWTGTKFASGVDKWQKEKFSPTNVQPVQNVGVPDKRERMNMKAERKGKASKQGPMLPSGKFVASKNLQKAKSKK